MGAAAEERIPLAVEEEAVAARKRLARTQPPEPARQEGARLAEPGALVDRPRQREPLRMVSAVQEEAAVLLPARALAALVVLQALAAVAGAVAAEEPASAVREEHLLLAAGAVAEQPGLEP